MKTLFISLIFFTGMSAGLFLLQGCGPDNDKFVCDCNGQKEDRPFCGTVSDSDGRPIAEALVEVGGKSTTTDKNGRFGIRVNTAPRFVLNVTKLGFGFVSKIYTDTICNVSIAMSTATVEEFVPEEGAPDEVIVIEDVTPPSSAPLSSNIGSLSSPLDTIPFVFNADGGLIGFRAPSTVTDTYQAAAEFQPPQAGAVVEVPADALIEQQETETAGIAVQRSKAKGAIVGSVSTVDIYSPDGMPGDYTVRDDNGGQGYMETFGAADVNFYRDGKPLQLKNGRYATLLIPVDTIALMVFGKKLRDTIPVFVYDKAKGEWVRDRDKWNRGKENVGILNKARTAYVAKVSHFSVFNMDEEFGNPTCYKICTPVGFPTGSGGARMEVAVPGHVKPFFPFAADCPDGAGCGGAGQYAHAVIKMQPDTPMGIRISDNAGVIKSTYVVFAGAPSPPPVPACAYVNCSGPAQITWWTTAANRPTYMDPSDDGTMSAPVIAIERRGTHLRISWVYIPDVSGTPSDYTTVTPRQYTIECSNDATFNTIDTSVTIVANTDWLNFYDLPVSQIATDSDDGSVPHKFRVRVGPVLAPEAVSSPALECYTPDADDFATCI